MENDEIARELYIFLTGDHVLDMRGSIVFAEPMFVLQQCHRLVATLRITEDRLHRLKISPLPGGSADELAEAV